MKLVVTAKIVFNNLDSASEVLHDLKGAIFTASDNPTCIESSLISRANVKESKAKMSKVLVIPDVHLKPVIFDRAEKILESGQADFAVQLGDLFDDFGEEFNFSLYKRTLNRAIRFHEKFPKTLWCMGNHDFGYYHPEYGRRETGHSRFMEDDMRKWLKRFAEVGIEQKLVQIVNNVIFSHAGLTCEWADKAKGCWDKVIDFLTLEKVSNAMLEEHINSVSNLDLLWDENSPLWVRPQRTGEIMFTDKMQVVGHTPMKGITFVDNILSTDVFSTYSNGAPYGERRFAIVDTEKMAFCLAKEDEC